MHFQRCVCISVFASLSLAIPEFAWAKSPWLVADSQTATPAQSSWRLPGSQKAGETASARRLRGIKSAALKWEIGYLALSGIDTVQTISCLHKGECKEANPIFGKHPKTGTLIAAKLAMGAAHFALFKYANDRSPMTALRMAQISCGIQGSVVLLNARFAFN
ncbi:MAG TPA: hypothetical protein VFG41_07400 [Sphingomicrobium sp.]|jgi:hypothetical protein|nr:hypothetical protein [Sphingomicrobium sp.]